ncbi:MAG: hypothetical protein NXI13_11625 [Proteobacteria bacterium]|nr:hypothetical protein [Pseudomonadota bacterium]
MKRGLAFFIVGIVVIVCIAIVVVYSSIGPIIIATIDDFGSRITGTKVTLADAEYSTTDGDATLITLTVANPKGFSDGNAFSFSKIELQVDPETLQNEVVVVKRMKVVSPEITYEISDTSDNLRALRNNIERSAEGEQQRSLQQTNEPPLKKFVINDLYFDTGVVIVQSSDMTGKRVTAVFEPLHMKDIGRETDGLYPAALIAEIYSPLLRAATIAAISTDLSLKDQAKNILEGATDEAEGALDKLRDLFKN